MTQETEVTVESTEQEVVGEVELNPTPEVEETPAEQTEEAAPSDVEESKPKGGFQRRISELTADKRFLERRLEALERLAQPPTQQAQPQAASEAAPKIEDYADLGQFIAATAAFEAKKIARVELTEHQKQQQENIRLSERQELNTKAAERMEVARGKYDDFDEAFGSSSELSEYMSEFILRTDDGMDVAYYLAKNPQESSRIARMDEFNASLALADVRSKVKLPVKKTNAPSPITPVKGSAKGEKDPSEMTDAEFASWRKHQIASRGNG